MIGRRCIAASLLSLPLAAPALAVDGEILINQATVNAGGITPGDGAGFPATLSRPGRYKLSGNLTVPANQTGIDVRANDATLDLHGFTISSDTPGEAAYGVSAQSTIRLRVANGTITGFKIWAVDLDKGALAVVENMRIVANTSAIQIGQSDSRIRNSTIANNGFGIYCTGCLIEGNVIAANSSWAITGPHGGGTVLGNVIVGNAKPGITTNTTIGYGSNILVNNSGGGPQVTGGPVQLHPNACNPACP